ncbi:C6 zinc finger domain-containing protein [Pleurostoma richardsiae]|uniref:C6 zinc finger domain-containing protein n=1 Tax=Pleurostoma richardsiae TaxID=41990 RepID=A0AA38RHA5_9PEZI|nr:C6 zinc finger domain-containing protein [Pleurostoma richardsiae]
MASSTPGSVSSQSKPTRILACVLCQHRKIKCDRHFPCANCTKANVTCTPSTPAPARKRRRPNQDLQERLARCEELLKEYANAKPETPPSPKLLQVPVYDDPYLKWNPAGKLVVEDGGVRFMDSFLLGTVYDELRAMREIIDDEDKDEDVSMDSIAMTPDDNSDMLLGGDSPGTRLNDLQPEAGQVFRLWQIYLDRVNPLTKIIHVPTLQPYLVEASTGSHNLPKNVEALLFSIYTLATVALSPEECQEMLGCSREKALQRFSDGVRLSLIRMGFLKCHDLLSLQALVIYLISLQGRYNRHAAWILNGVVIRIAQKMGLHRDGELLRLSPFETEMRRRLWWQIIMLDAKYAMLSGLSHSLMPRSWDTQAPRNVNDADLFPSSTEPVRDRDGPTEMIVVLVTYKIAKFLVQSPSFESILLANELEGMEGKMPDQDRVQEYRALVGSLGKELNELVEKYCDPSAGPLHALALQMKTHIMEKLVELFAPPKYLAEWGDEVKNHKDNAFRIAVTATEHGIDQYKQTAHQGFLWFSRLHFQLDIFVYLVGQLCYRTSGALVERAWILVEETYHWHPELLDTTQKSYSRLAVFVLKAWKIREEVLRTRLGTDPETPEYVSKLRASMPPQDDSRSEVSTTDSIVPKMNHMEGTDATFDQLVGTYLDFNNLDFDIFGNMVPANIGPQGITTTAPYPFGLAPQPEW